MQALGAICQGRAGLPRDGFLTFDRPFKALNCYATQVRRVADEDRASLERAGHHFNIHVLMGGQLAGDKDRRRSHRVQAQERTLRTRMPFRPMQR